MAFGLAAIVPGTPALLGLFALAGLINGPLFCSLLVVRDREAPAAVRTLGVGLKVTAAAAGAALAGITTGLGPVVLLFAVAAVLSRRPVPPASP